MTLADLALEAPGVWTIIGGGVGMLSGLNADTGEEAVARTVAGGVAGLAVSLSVVAIRARRYRRGASIAVAPTQQPSENT